MHVYIFIATVNTILSIISYTYLRLHFQFARTPMFIIVFLLLLFNLIGSRMLPAGAPLIIVKASAWLAGLWLAIMYYILLISILHGCIHILDKLGHFRLPHLKIAAAAVSFVFCFVAWGSFRALYPVIRTEKISTSKLTGDKSYKIVFLTDLHLGQILGRSYAEKLVERVNSQNADLILISGDILDERIRYIELENSLEPLKNLKSRLGTFMAYGNHDYLDRPALWEALLEQNKIHVLRDRDVILDEQLKITGINDWSRDRSDKQLIALSVENASYYSVLMDHQPRRIEAAAQAGYDLYLAGHTHTGQLFPNRLITKRMYKLDYGRANFQGMTAVTNNGYGFWGTPVRTELAPEMVIIELQGK